MERDAHLWITYFGLCALFWGKTQLTPRAQVLLLVLLGLPFSWWSVQGLRGPGEEGFSSGVRIVRENGKPCLLREKGITYRGCYYSDVGGCAIPDEGLKGDCPADYGDFRRQYGGPKPSPSAAVPPSPPAEECTGDAWVKIVSLRDDEVEALVAKGTHPLSACVKQRSEMVRKMRDRFLQDLKNADNTQDVCTRVRRDELKASNRVARQMFRDVYQECFRDLEPATSSVFTSSSTGEGPRVKTSGFVLLDEPEMLTIDKNGHESDDVLRRHMRQEFVGKCQKFVSQKTPEQIQAFIELGERVQNLEWWKSVSLAIEKTADEIRKAQLLSTSRTGIVG